MKALDNQHKQALRDVLDQQDALLQKKAEIKEAIAAVAEKLDVKPAAVNRMLALVRKEYEQRGALDTEQELLDCAIEIAR